MKRSEMLKIIEYCWSDSTSYPSDRLVAEYILKSMEEAGMLAPTVMDGLYVLNEWENEDD